MATPVKEPNEELQSRAERLKMKAQRASKSLGLKARVENGKAKAYSNLAKIEKIKAKNTESDTVSKTASNKEPSMNKYDSLLEKFSAIKKEAFVPGEQVGAAAGGMPPIDPATGIPIDPMTGMPIDPAMMGGAGGMPPMPMDPSMMGGGGGGAMPPGADPAAMGGMPMDPAAMGGMPPVDPATGMPMDPAMMGGMPPEAAPAPAEGGEAGTGAPATVDELAVIEERITGLEDIIEDLVDTIEALGGKKLSDAKVESAAAPDDAAGAEVPAQPGLPGPLAPGASDALAMINPGATGNTLNNLMGKLGELRAG